MKRGFTLIELLVVIVILVSIVGVIGACLSAGIRVWDTARAFNTVETDVTLGMATFERDYMNSFNFFDIPFSGSMRSCSFPGMIRTENNDLLRLGTIKYFFDRYDKILYRKEWIYPEDEPPSKMQSERIMSDIKNIDMEYFKAGPSGSDLARPDYEWNNPTNHPLMMKVHVDFMSGNESRHLERTFFSHLDRDDRTESEK